jgi:fatty-acid desaturase
MGIDGLLHFSIWEMVLATLVLTHITIVSVTVYLHRYSAHRALELSPVLQHFFSVLALADHGHGYAGVDRHSPQAPRDV